MGPTAGNTFWAGFGGQCQSHNDGDPLIQHDKMANHWVATQFAINVGTGPFLQCVAVLTTRLPMTRPAPITGIPSRSPISTIIQGGGWPDGYYFNSGVFICCAAAS
jgi:hypothetical protein